MEQFLSQHEQSSSVSFMEGHDMQTHERAGSTDDMLSEELRFIHQLNPKEKKALANAVFATLNASDRKEVLQQVPSTRSPLYATTHFIWLIIIVSFALVLVGSFLSLALGILLLHQTIADAELQILLTIFTAVVGFFAGLLSPSPTQSHY
jgi:hypothetical protein